MGKTKLRMPKDRDTSRRVWLRVAKYFIYGGWVSIVADITGPENM
jgi:hypothetical protein